MKAVGYPCGGNLFAAERFHERWPPYVFMNDVETQLQCIITTDALLIRWYTVAEWLSTVYFKLSIEYPRKLWQFDSFL